MVFFFYHPHKNVSVIRFEGPFCQNEWPLYESQFLSMYEQYKHSRFIVVYDLRDIDMNVAELVPLILNKKNMLVKLKPITSRRQFCSIVLTPYVLIRELAINILRLSGQVSLFHVFTTAQDVAAKVDELTAILHNERLPCSSRHSLKWGDISTAQVYALLIAFYIRIARHHLAKK